MDFLNSFFQNIKDKLSSPFFGTLTFIIIIHHWEFWYTLFNFDKDCTRTEKLATLRLIGVREFGNYRLIYDILFALAIMLIGYLVVMGTRTLSLAIEFRFMPWITGKVISKKVVDRTDHEKMVNERDEYSEKYEEQRKLVRTFSKDYDQQAAQIQTKNDSITMYQVQITDLQNANSDLETRLSNERHFNRALTDENRILKTGEDSLNSTINKQINKMEVMQENQDNLLNTLLESKVIDGDPNSIPKAVILKSDELKSSGDWENFKMYVDFERNGGTINGSIVTRMRELGLANNNQNERISPLGAYLAAYVQLIPS